MSNAYTRRKFLAVTGAAAAAAWTPLPSPAAQTANANAGKKVLRAGAHAIDITPKKLPVIVNGGMLERTAGKIVDRLHARCLVLDDGTTRIAIVMVDSCALSRSLADRAKKLAHAATGIRTDRMLLAATHTHSAPSVCGALGSSVDEEYAKVLPGLIAKGIELACKNLAPARVGWAVGRDPKNVFCRRYLMKPGAARTCPFTGTENDQAQMNPGYLNPNAVKRLGPVDDSVTVLSVQTPDGRPLALLGNYSTHYAGSPAVSADYFGVFARRIGELIGAKDAMPPFVGMMSNGTSGDANCCDFDHARRKFDHFTVAEDVARAAHEAYKRIEHHDGASLAMEEKLLTLAVRVPPADEVAEAKRVVAKMKDGKPRSTADVYARETVLLAAMPPTRELKLQAIRIGSLGITAIPNEAYGSTGLAIKKNSPLRPTLNTSLANGCEGYIPPPDQHKLGGYTTWRARTSCLEVDAEPKITAAVLEALKSVAGS